MSLQPGKKIGLATEICDLVRNQQVNHVSCCIGLHYYIRGCKILRKRRGEDGGRRTQAVDERDTDLQAQIKKRSIVKKVELY